MTEMRTAESSRNSEKQIPVHVRAVLEKGILATSADNLQPWRFKVDQNTIDFYLDKELINSFVDEGYLAPYISAGAVLENIMVAATGSGFGCQVQHFPDKENPLWVFRAVLKKAAPQTHPHFGFLEKRVTNRKFYLGGKSIPQKAYDSLNKVFDKSDFRLGWIKKKDKRYADLTRLIGDADQMRFEVRRLHEEFTETLRYGKDVEASRDGLDARSLESGPTGPAMFKWITPWGRMKSLNRLGMSRLFNLYARLQMKSSQAAGLIIAPSHEPIDYVKGGSLLGRLWHEAAKEGLSLQPMEGLPIFILNLLLNGGRDFTQSQRSKLQSLKQEFFSAFDITEKNGLILMFRIGYAASPSTRSLRRPLDSFLI